MSRRLRKEKGYAKQLQQEVHEEENRMKKLHEKIFGPLVWATLPSGYRIQDLQENYYSSVVDLIHKYYTPREVLCRNANILEDEISLKSFTAYINFVMKDWTSIIILDENNEDELVGVLLMNVVNFNTYDHIFNRLIHGNGEGRQKCNAITNVILKEQNLFEIYKCDKYIRYHLVCIKDEHRKKALGYQLMNAGLKVSVTLDVYILCGIFTSLSYQDAAKKLGFTLTQQISYVNWRDADKELIFDDPGPGNYSCAFMVKIIPTVKDIESADKTISNAKELESPIIKNISEKSLTNSKNSN